MINPKSSRNPIVPIIWLRMIMYMINYVQPSSTRCELVETWNMGLLIFEVAVVDIELLKQTFRQLHV